jgi:DNA-binding NarL/FixJ family response regulator
MNIVIADDHELIVDGFRSVIQGYPEQHRVSVALSRAELDKVLEEDRIDILFQDIKFGADDARDFIRPIKKRYPEMKIIIISSVADTLTVEMLFKQGVDGYLLKSDPSAEIAKAIASVVNEEVYISPGIRAPGYFSLKKTTDSIHLTPREKEVLRLILKAHTSREIATEIHLSEKTVENHRTNLFLKFDAKNIAALVRKAILMGYL